jgi:hypothetical protein
MTREELKNRIVSILQKSSTYMSDLGMANDILQEFTNYQNDEKPPTDEEIEEIAKMLSKESTAPDKDTPDWMIADIKRGLKYMRDNYMNKQ